MFVFKQLFCIHQAEVYLYYFNIYIFFLLGDRRIRVHTLCLPIISDFSKIFNYFDIKATTSLLSKMGMSKK